MDIVEATYRASTSLEEKRSIIAATAPCSLGYVLLAFTYLGTCAIFLGDDTDGLWRQLEAEFVGLQIIKEELNLNPLVDFIEEPKFGFKGHLDIIKYTPFQLQVWQALQSIPVGQTRSYAEIANQIGRPKSIRAVANACSSNRLAVVIPCHRVIRADGSMSGYRWGLEKKKTLLLRENPNFHFVPVSPSRPWPPEAPPRHLYPGCPSAPGHR